MISPKLAVAAVLLLTACPTPEATPDDTQPPGDTDTDADADTDTDTDADSDADTDIPLPTIELGALIEVLAGTFVRGGEGEESQALPEHEVTLTRSYRLGQTEVTNAQLASMLNRALALGLLDGNYEENETVTNAEGASRELVNLDGEGSIGDNRSRIAFDGEAFTVEDGWEQHPANWLSWFGAAFFCNLLSEQEGLTPLYDLDDWTAQTYGAAGYRLPTEAEWERAARYDDGRSWPWGDSPEPDETIANYDYQLNHTAEICGYPSGDSALGFCDMAGNVLEWTQDWHAPYGEDALTDPIVDSGDGRRVIRGGSWNHEVDRLLTWDRYYDPLPSESYGGIGFRLVKISAD